MDNVTVNDVDYMLGPVAFPGFYFMGINFSRSYRLIINRIGTSMKTDLSTQCRS